MNRYGNVTVMLFSVVVLAIVAISPLAGVEHKAVATQSASDCWTQDPSPAVTGKFYSLNSIAAISENDVWAVGKIDLKTLTMHWDGAQWSVVPSPSIDAPINILTAVSGVSSNDVWAVGYAAGNSINSSAGPLTMHWNGIRWSMVDNQAPGEINAVDALSATDVWAVGDRGRGQNGGQPFIAHWDGSQWSYTDSRQLHVNDYMQGVVALAKDNVWAVGSSILHWDGSQWNTVIRDAGDLNAVAASAPDDVWAVGRNITRTASVIHWDGKGWSNVAITGDGSASLVRVTAISRNNAWAVSVSGKLFHWDGVSWKGDASLPSLPAHYFTAVTSTGSYVWIAGYETVSPDNGSALRGIILRRSSTSCLQPAPTPAPPPDPPVAVPGSESNSFPETGKTVSGLFLSYWQSHGGLMQQGFPISEVIGNVSELDGKVYTTQYFERAVFEYHPENKAPYDVLLSQLGTFKYKSKYPAGAFKQQPNKEGRYLYFSDTEHYVGGSFLDYWQNNGGLAQQGFPISDEFTEISETDGKPYTVQYFERAVFEYHPENLPPYNVLLSHLGRFSYDAKYGEVKSAQPAPNPQLIAASKGYGGAATDRYLFWPDIENPYRPTTVYGYDLLEKKKFLVSDTANISSALDYFTANDSVLVWFEIGNTPRVHEYNITDKKESVLLAGAKYSDINGLSLDGNILYFSREFQEGIFAYNLSTGSIQQINGKGRGPVAADGKLLWSEPPASCSYCISNSTLHLRIIDGSISDRIIAQSGENRFTSYAFSGDNVVWSGSSVATTLYNISSNTTHVLTQSKGVPVVVKDNLVVWGGDRKDPAVKIYNVVTGRLSEMYQPTGPWIKPLGIIEGKILAYSAGDERSRVDPLYIVDLSQVK